MGAYLIAIFVIALLLILISAVKLISNKVERYIFLFNSLD